MPHPKKSKRTLPKNLKKGVEDLSGISLDEVQIHYNSSVPEKLGATAYAQGTSIRLTPGQQGHLPYKAWHIEQQQQQLKIMPTVEKKENTPINNDQRLEKEADILGTVAIKEDGKL